MSSAPPTSQPAHSVGEQLLYAAIILALGDIAGKVLALIITIIRTRTLTGDEFGGYGFIISTIGMFAQIAGFSLGMAATRFVAMHRDHSLSNTRAISQFITLVGLTTTVISMIALYVLAPFLVKTVPDLLVPLRWSVLILGTQTPSGLVLGLLIGMQRYRAATLASFSQNVVMLIFTVWLIPQAGLDGAIWATAIGFLMTVLLAWYQAWDLLSWPWEPWSAIWSHRRILVEFCLPTLLAGFIVLPAGWISVVLVEHATNRMQIALFYAADQFRPLLTLLGGVVSQPMVPLVTSLVSHALRAESQEDRHQYQRKAQRAIERSFQLAACLILPIHAMLAFAGPYVMALFGRTFAADWNVFLTMLAFAAYGGIATLTTQTLISLNRVWLQNLIQILFGVLLIAITWLLKDWGAIGIGLAYFIGTFLSLSVTSLILFRSGYLTWFAIVVQLAAFSWLLAMSLASAYTPDAWRPWCVPLAFLATAAFFYLTMKSEMMHVISLIRRKLNARRTKSTVIESGSDI
ncbi:MAG: oligosaccharide flippase family protein [Planctomycetia bacterium]|nr:oligosaccharide flippase family protein [Planctomycetia bacterium]